MTSARHSAGCGETESLRTSPVDLAGFTPAVRLAYGVITVGSLVMLRADPPRERRTMGSAYDQHSNPVQRDTEDIPPYGDKDLDHSTLEYDDRGRLVETIDEHDLRADGSVEERITTNNEYGEQGN